MITYATSLDYVGAIEAELRIMADMLGDRYDHPRVLKFLIAVTALGLAQWERYVAYYPADPAERFQAATAADQARFQQELETEIAGLTPQQQLRRVLAHLQMQPMRIVQIDSQGWPIFQEPNFQEPAWTTQDLFLAPTQSLFERLSGWRSQIQKEDLTAHALSTAQASHCPGGGAHPDRNPDQAPTSHGNYSFTGGGAVASDRPRRLPPDLGMQRQPQRPMAISALSGSSAQTGGLP